jgi:signal transduction histidine kinase
MNAENHIERILLVDDMPSTIAVIKTILEEQDYEVFVATSGEKALKRAALIQPDLILLDILMPGMDGYTTCQYLKADRHTAKIPVIFMSALTEVFDKVKGFTLGAVDYVVKPVETEELLVRVQTHITMHHLQNALEGANTRLEERVLARTRELREANMRLKQGEEEAQKQKRDLQRLSSQLIRAQETERRTISQELHDEMGQRLTAMHINLVEIEKSLMPECSSVVKERLTETLALVDHTLEQIRELSLDLRPSMLDDLGLVPTLRWYINRYARRLNIEVRFSVMNVEQRLDPEIETTLYRVVQEALTNVAKHARATEVRIRLERTESTLTALIEDNGQGGISHISHGKHLRQGIGLLGMQERVTGLGGEFRIQSPPGQGTQLLIEIPIV